MEDIRDRRSIKDQKEKGGKPRSKKSGPAPGRHSYLRLALAKWGRAAILHSGPKAHYQHDQINSHF